MLSTRAKRALRLGVAGRVLARAVSGVLKSGRGRSSAVTRSMSAGAFRRTSSRSTRPRTSTHAPEFASSSAFSRDLRPEASDSLAVVSGRTAPGPPGPAGRDAPPAPAGGRRRVCLSGDGRPVAWDAEGPGGRRPGSGWGRRPGRGRGSRWGGAFACGVPGTLPRSSRFYKDERPCPGERLVMRSAYSQ